MYIVSNQGCCAVCCDCLNALRNVQTQVALDNNIAITAVCRDLLATAPETSDIHFIKAKGHLHEELALVGVTDADLPPGETCHEHYQPLPPRAPAGLVTRRERGLTRPRGVQGQTSASHRRTTPSIQTTGF